MCLKGLAFEFIDQNQKTFNYKSVQRNVDKENDSRGKKDNEKINFKIETFDPGIK